MSSSPPSPRSSSLSSKAMGYLFLLSLQFGIQPILTRRYTPQSINRSTVVIIQDLVKFAIAMGMLNASGEISKAFEGWTFINWLSVAGVPAALYCIQNFCALMAYQNLDAITFNVLNQTKTLSAALCCYLIMGRKQTRVQLVALILLLVAALVIEKIITLDTLFLGILVSTSDQATDDLSSSRYWTTRHMTQGVLPVLTASFLSGLAGALCQKNLQNDKTIKGGTGGAGRNSYLLSAELCMASLVLLFFSLFVTEDGARILTEGFFHKWTPYTLIPIVSNAVGGIIVGLVTKYAGSVRKGFALIFGIILTGPFQALFARVGTNDNSISADGGSMSNADIVGGILAAISLWMYTTHPYKGVSPPASAFPAPPNQSSARPKQE